MGCQGSLGQRVTTYRPSTIFHLPPYWVKVSSSVSTVGVQQVTHFQETSFNWVTRYPTRRTRMGRSPSAPVRRRSRASLPPALPEPRKKAAKQAVESGLSKAHRRHALVSHHHLPWHAVRQWGSPQEQVSSDILCCVLGEQSQREKEEKKISRVFVLKKRTAQEMASKSSK